MAMLPNEAMTQIAPERLWRLSVPAYHQMQERGILTATDPVELLSGLLVAKLPKKPTHRIATKLVRDAIATLLPAGWYVDTQEPIALQDSEPEPDVMVVRGDTRDYTERHPGAADLALVVEIADATLTRDRQLKQAIYAYNRIAEYWIVNLEARQIEQYREPAATGYQQLAVIGAEGAIAVAIADQDCGTLAVSELLP